ncbi:MAG: peptidoglycan DD-metalloendopeptidase family protein [Brevefilum sp.]|nr:peptidoglycan DD-metalloendopeptidase family protein [Brevefilum sp.]MDT8382311.1 peptidoglycan DD-metalloendopeptidase family protein [Brevefilum sp.]MDW7755116.1 peptidoglycan DD-metalloendopeptidase family protein [Brevefilum sp.]
MKRLYLLIIAVMLSACQPQLVASTVLPPSPTLEPSASPSPTQTKSSTSQPTQTMLLPTSTIQAFQVCSPLEEETLDTLSSILVNPLVIPPFGRDDGHHGLDFSYYRRDARESIEGIGVFTILSGTTVLILPDEIPYGNTIVIETPLSELPESLQEKLQSFYQLIPEDIYYQGECPEISPPTFTGRLSVYHLYAHLENPPSFQMGEVINCGVQLGTVGNTGRSSNPHLHLETRLGPSGADLGDMAFYETKYTEAQQANYCLWRMSGYFQLFDPYLIFNAWLADLTH